MEPTIDPTDQLASIVSALCDTAARIDVDQLANPTPWNGHSVHDVLDHLIVQGAAFTYLFAGMEPPELTAPPVYGRVPAAELHESMHDLLGAVRSSGALDRSVETPYGRMPAATFARFVAVVALIHGWDLTVSTGAPFRVARPVVDAVDAFARIAITDDLRDGTTFRPATEPPVLGSALDRLAAFGGRTVRALATAS